MLWQAAYPAFIVGLAAIAALVLITLILAHRFVAPIRRLGDRAATIAEGNFEPLPVTRRNDEIRDLALSINCMAERLSRYENEVRRHEQLRTLGQLGAGLAHQLRNAATGGRMAIELHRLHCPAKADLEEAETLEVALRQLQLMESYLQRFLALGQTNHAPHEPLNLESLVQDALDLARPRLTHAGIELVYNQRFAPGRSPRGTAPAITAVSVSGDANALRQLFVNLIINAAEAVSGSSVQMKRIEVEVGSSADHGAVVKISDSGPGPAPEVAARLFEPFVTDKSEGTGLGLYVAHQTVQNHCGKIDWHRNDGMTRFTVELPICES
jgi:signal transduction histidine kinase